MWRDIDANDLGQQSQLSEPHLNRRSHRAIRVLLSNINSPRSCAVPTVKDTFHRYNGREDESAVKHNVEDVVL